MAYFRCGGGGMPAGLQSGMDSVLNKKFGTSTTYPASGWPDNVNLLGPLPIIISNTEPIVSIKDGADDVPIEQGTFYVDYDANGYTGMTITKAGKNLLENQETSRTESDVTFTVNSDGSVSLSGTATAEINFTVYSNFTFPKLGNYVISGCPSGGSTSTYRIFATNYGSDTGSGLSVNVTNLSTKTSVRINIKSGTNTNGLTFKPMIETGSTATAYSAFTSETLPVSWSDVAGTIYGGNLNITTGVLTSTKAADGTDLAEPVEYQLTQHELRTFYGANNFYCDTGDSQLNYRADISLYINNH